VGFLKGHKKLGGRKPGTPNKAAEEVRLLIEENADMPKVIKKLAVLAVRGNVPAARLLMEYRYGKSFQMQVLHGQEPEEELTPEEARAIFDQVFGVSPTERKMRDGELAKN